jgi:hypothetical protein
MVKVLQEDVDKLKKENARLLEEKSAAEKKFSNRR